MNEELKEKNLNNTQTTVQVNKHLSDGMRKGEKGITSSSRSLIHNKSE
jgi:hypothetical protein